MSFFLFLKKKREEGAERHLSHAYLDERSHRAERPMRREAIAVAFFFYFVFSDFDTHISESRFPRHGHQTPRDMLIILPEFPEALGLYNECMMSKTPWA